MKSVFNGQMSTFELMNALFTAVDGKTKAEADALQAEHDRLLPEAIRRESELAQQGWLLG